MEKTQLRIWSKKCICMSVSLPTAKWENIDRAAIDLDITRSKLIERATDAYMDTLYTADKNTISCVK